MIFIEQEASRAHVESKMMMVMMMLLLLVMIAFFNIHAIAVHYCVCISWIYFVLGGSSQSAGQFTPLLAVTHLPIRTPLIVGVLTH